jgi:hypothetical protein
MQRNKKDFNKKYNNNNAETEVNSTTTQRTIMTKENTKENREKLEREDEFYFQMNPYPHPSSVDHIDSIECDGSSICSINSSSKSKQNRGHQPILCL